MTPAPNVSEARNEHARHQDLTTRVPRQARPGHGARRHRRVRVVVPAREPGARGAVCAAPAGRAAGDGLSRKVHQVRPVRAGLPVRHAETRRRRRHDPHRYALLYPARGAVLHVPGHPLQGRLPHRRARSETFGHRAGAHGARGHRQRELPVVARVALRGLLPRVPGEGQGHHRRASPAAREQARDVRADRAQRPLHRLRRVREVVPDASGRNPRGSAQPRARQDR